MYTFVQNYCLTQLTVVMPVTYKKEGSNEAEELTYMKTTNYILRFVSLSLFILPISLAITNAFGAEIHSIRVTVENKSLPTFHYVQASSAEELSQALNDHGVTTNISLCWEFIITDTECEYAKIGRSSLADEHFDWLTESTLERRFVLVSYFIP